jgi:hypothetical protein
MCFFPWQVPKALVAALPLQAIRGKKHKNRHELHEFKEQNRLWDGLWRAAAGLSIAGIDGSDLLQGRRPCSRAVGSRSIGN